MNKIVWKICYTYCMCRRIKDFWPSGIGFGWYNSGIWADEYGTEEMAPADAVDEEISCWGDDD